jgi:hypothetical protein
MDPQGTRRHRLAPGAATPVQTEAPCRFWWEGLCVVPFPTLEWVCLVGLVMHLPLSATLLCCSQRKTAWHHTHPGTGCCTWRHATIWLKCRELSTREAAATQRARPPLQTEAEYLCTLRTVSGTLSRTLKGSAAARTSHHNCRRWARAHRAQGGRHRRLRTVPSNSEPHHH